MLKKIALFLEKWRCSCLNAESLKSKDIFDAGDVYVDGKVRSILEMFVFTRPCLLSEEGPSRCRCYD